jgi:hypothetical protein
MSMSDLAKRARARELKRVEVLDWYLANNGGKGPQQQCEDKKPYGDLIYWWLEPLIPGVMNYRIVERAIGDGWGLAIEPFPGTEDW